jgi:hypothetical protein
MKPTLGQAIKGFEKPGTGKMKKAMPLKGKMRPKG